MSLKLLISIIVWGNFKAKYKEFNYFQFKNICIVNNSVLIINICVCYLVVLEYIIKLMF